jgi:hypothetical protein
MMISFGWCLTRVEAGHLTVLMIDWAEVWNTSDQ